MSGTAGRYIAWDTSSLVGILAAFEIENGLFKPVATWSLSLETSKHSERLLWSLDTVLQSAGWRVDELAGIAVGVGPGSFTGLRIGITTAKMLARTLGVPVFPLSSLALLARGSALRLDSEAEPGAIQILAATDAAKGEWFTLTGSWRSARECLALAEGDLPGIWGRGVSESVLPPEEAIRELQERLQKRPDSRWLAVGQSVLRYPELFEALPRSAKIEVDDPALHRVQPGALARLAFEAVQQGLVRSASQIHPRYLRASEAEINLKNGRLRPSPVHPRGGRS
jgi:tRNA threonylcarbamoyladenosine biosynthesis protein TsaB